MGHHTIKFLVNQNVFNTRNSTNLRVARCRIELTKQKISYIGCSEFNKLPNELKNLRRISLFKSEIKKYIYNEMDNIFI